MRRPNLTKEDWVDTVSGALSGAITAVAVCPLDVLRTRLQLQSHSRKYRGVIGGVGLIFREEGIPGLYRGLTPTLIALIPNWAVYFSIYEHIKHSYRPYFQEKHQSKLHLLAAVSAGTSTVFITNPLWVIKTRLQTQDMGLPTRWSRYRGTIDGLCNIARNEGLGRLYAGLVPSLIGVAHTAIQFPLYEYLKRRLASRGQRSHDQLKIPELVLASSLSKMVASTLTYPHEVLRSHMHFNGTKPFSGLASMIRTIRRKEGMKGFYKGCGVNLCRTVPSAAITFTSFELITRLLNRWMIESKRKRETQKTKMVAT